MRRLLLDEGVARSLARALHDLGIDATAFPNDWKQIPDGRLLDRMMAAGYDLLLTSDKNMAFQQVLGDKPIAVLILDQVDRRRVQLQALAIAKELDSIAVGRFWRLSPDGRVLIFPTTIGM